MTSQWVSPSVIVACGAECIRLQMKLDYNNLNDLLIRDDTSTSYYRALLARRRGLLGRRPVRC
jgi:hypothetical protein